jgi:hypothetical protein
VRRGSSRPRSHRTRVPAGDPRLLLILSMRDYWLSSGYRPLDVDAAGQRIVTDDFVRSCLLRPELAPIAESWVAEIEPHDALLDDPLRTMSAALIAALADPDAQDNYRIWMRLRDRLPRAPTIEAAYRGRLPARASMSRFSPNAKAMKRAGHGPSDSTPRQVRCSTTCTIASMSPSNAWSDCCAYSN